MFASTFQDKQQQQTNKQTKLKNRKNTCPLQDNFDPKSFLLYTCLYNYSLHPLQLCSNFDFHDKLEIRQKIIMCDNIILVYIRKIVRFYSDFVFFLRMRVMYERQLDKNINIVSCTCLLQNLLR